jgi:type IV secretion system protein VirB11
VSAVHSIERDGSRLVLARYLEPLAPFLEDKSLTEIVVNRPGEIFVEGPGGWNRHEAPALTHAYLSHLATAAAGHTRQDIDPEHPVVSTTLIGEERCQIVVPPAVPAGTVSLTIRKPSALTMTLDAFEQAELFDDVRAASDELTADEHRLLALKEAGAWRDFLQLAVSTRRNIIISGATGSGKTTLSKALIGAIPAHERLITIEDTAELVIPHQNCVRLLYAKDGQGLAKIGSPGSHSAAGAARWDGVLLSEECELGPSGIDHNGSCRQRPARLRATDVVGKGKRGRPRPSSRRHPLAAATSRRRRHPDAEAGRPLPHFGDIL